MINDQEEVTLNQNKSDTPIQSDVSTSIEATEKTDIETEVETLENTSTPSEGSMSEISETETPLSISTEMENIASIEEVTVSTEKENTPTIEEVTVEEEKAFSTDSIVALDEVPHTELDDLHDEHTEDEGLEDYSHYTKSQFIQLAHKLADEVETNKNFKKAIQIVKEIKPYFDEIAAAEKQAALQEFIKEGGEEDGFDFKQDKDSKSFYQFVNQIYKSRTQHIKQLEEQKEKNLEKKQAVLDKIRALSESEENQASIEELKKLQIEWKSIGSVAPQHNKELWANYNALIDRFYNNLTIYSELKELDKKKNLAMKLAICEKAEKLADHTIIQKAIKELNELHEEYKHIGPVPKEEQEMLWQRFKSASDKVYEKKREFIKQREAEKQENLLKKLALIEEVKPFADVKLDKIAAWNDKTKELLGIQKKWEEIRFVPREKFKEISKEFWSYFKIFFANKNAFIHTLDQEREQNLALKNALCEEAQLIIQSQEDHRKIADKLKQLQHKWKEIGPVPGKYRDSIYNRFKKICDDFFEGRRKEFNSQEQSYEQNLKQKQALCNKIDQFNADAEQVKDFIQQFVEEWRGIGFVPKKDKDKIQAQFETSMYAFVNRVNNLSADEKEKYHLEVDLQIFKESPNANKKLQQKESALKRQISKLENDIDVWKNNIGFFASSSKANKLKESMETQIQEATEKLKVLKKQLKIFQNL